MNIYTCKRVQTFQMFLIFIHLLMLTKKKNNTTPVFEKNDELKRF